MPPRDLQRNLVARIDAIVQRIDQCSHKANLSTDRLREFRSAFITAAVTVQIDLPTWGKQGTTDRWLDDIEAEMAAAAPPEREKARA